MILIDGLYDEGAEHYEKEEYDQAVNKFSHCLQLDLIQTFIRYNRAYAYSEI